MFTKLNRWSLAVFLSLIATRYVNQSTSYTWTSSELFVSKEEIAAFKSIREITPSYTGDASGISASTSARSEDFALFTSSSNSSEDSIDCSLSELQHQESLQEFLHHKLLHLDRLLNYCNLRCCFQYYSFMKQCL